MKYRVTCLTPTLVGDGGKLSPIDYMVWKDHVNVLDQPRIFKLLAKGPRLDGYLAQLRKADKLDFANWGGFAQNFADRRIPFEHASITGFWEKQRAESLFIPTFCAGPNGPYLPGSALRGALHTALLYSRWNENYWKQIEERFQGDRVPRRPAEPAEEQGIGLGGASRVRSFGIGDSGPVSHAGMKVYLLRTATLVSRGTQTELGWKQSPRGTVEARRVDDSAPLFCEMAAPGTVFEGAWLDRRPGAEVAKMLRWKHPVDGDALFGAANGFSEKVLGMHRQYARAAGLKLVDQALEAVEAKLGEAKSGGGCVLALGWGGGFLSKVSYPETTDENYRRVLRQLPYYARAIQSGMPFPKTRRIVFLNGQPASLPGWVYCERIG